MKKKLKKKQFFRKKVFFKLLVIILGSKKVGLKHFKIFFVLNIFAFFRFSLFFFKRYF